MALTLIKLCESSARLLNVEKRINTSVTLSVTKDSSVAAVANVKYKVAFWHALWVFSIDQCISSLFFFITVLLSAIFVINK